VTVLIRLSRAEGPAGLVNSHVPEALAPPEGNPRFPALDGLRAIAALSVLIFHADQFTGAQNSSVGRLLSHLDVGVAVFFVITGFLLYRPFFASLVGDAPKTPTKLFYRRRALRIIPGYWVALVVLAPLIVYAEPLGLPNFLFIQIYRPAWARSGIPPGWSVCVEVSFYLLLPLFGGLMRRWLGHLPRKSQRRRQLILLSAMGLASVLFRLVAMHVIKSPYVVDPLPGTFFWFALGMGLAVISVEPHFQRRNIVSIATRHPFFVWLTAIAIYGSTLTSGNDATVGEISLFIRYGLIAMLIVSPLVFGDPRRFIGTRMLQAKITAWLGLVSYGIYLYHYPIMNHIHFQTGSKVFNLVCLALVGVLIATICAACSYYLVERPMLRFKHTAPSSSGK
jgi:peptidoglycan/LPS O-acetylase OafA/YrhL